MADRSSARVLGQVFKILAARAVTAEVQEIAQSVAALIPSCDFTVNQMDADKALATLRLCGSCGRTGPSDIPYPCPYRVQIEHDDQTLCSCCDRCRDECERNI